MKVDACVPSHNNESTLPAVLDSIQSQTAPVCRVFVIDDGSTDNTAEVARSKGATIISLGSNLGRGAARAQGFEESEADLILSVDGTNALAADFLERCLLWFDDDKVAAVYGRLIQIEPATAVDRWRGRHLFKSSELQERRIAKSLITWGYVARRTAIIEVGNFDRRLRQREDLELGQRLLTAGWKIGFEPNACVTTLVSNTWEQVMERFLRWNYGEGEPTAWSSRLVHGVRMLKYFWGKDLRDRDLGSIHLSFRAACRIIKELRGTRIAAEQ